MFLTAAIYGGTGLLVLLVLLFLAYTAYTGYIHWKYSHIPSPERPSFYFGHVGDIWELRKKNGKEFPFSIAINYWAEKVSSPTFVVFFAIKPMIVTLDPEVVKAIAMNKDNPKPKHQRDLLHTVFGVRFFGDRLVNETHYERWKPQRKLYDPAFNKAYLKTIVKSFNESITAVIEDLRPVADGKTEIPLKKYIHKITLDIISKVAFGSDFSKQWTAESLGIILPPGQSDVLQYIVEQAMKAINRSFVSIYPPLNQYLYPTEGKCYRSCLKAMRKMGRECIMKRIKMIQNGEEVPEDILSCMLKGTTGDMNIEDLVDDFCTFYVAGQETTASVLTFSVILLFQHPNIMERLQQEITDVLEDRTEVTNSDLENLQFTEQVLFETLRLYPAVDGVMKSVEVTTKIGKYSFPAGSNFMLMNANMCRLPQYFDDPDSFNPDRFHPDNKRPNSFVYFPFGIGHRSCIGKHMAIMEGKIALARLLQTFKITLPSDYVIRRGTNQPKDDVLCTLSCH